MPPLAGGFTKLPFAPNTDTTPTDALPGSPTVTPDRHHTTLGVVHARRRRRGGLVRRGAHRPTRPRRREQPARRRPRPQRRDVGGYASWSSFRPLSDSKASSVSWRSAEAVEAARPARVARAASGGSADDDARRSRSRRERLSIRLLRQGIPSVDSITLRVTSWPSLGSPRSRPWAGGELRPRCRPRSCVPAPRNQA